MKKKKKKKPDLPDIKRARAFRMAGDRRAYHESINFIRQRDGEAQAFAFTHAVEANIRPELRRDLAPILAGTRQAEGGRRGRQYGVLDPRAKEKKYTGAGSKDPRLNTMYRQQAGWSASTLQKNWDRYVAGEDIKGLVDSAGKPRVVYGNRTDPSTKPLNVKDFLTLYHQIYAPPDVKNDPKGMNKVWLKNTRSTTSNIQDLQREYNNKYLESLKGKPKRTDAQIRAKRNEYNERWF